VWGLGGCVIFVEWGGVGGGGCVGVCFVGFVLCGGVFVLVVVGGGGWWGGGGGVGGGWGGVSFKRGKTPKTNRSKRKE